jgi:FMN phosphatase YigB (HAD superfamily)
MKNIDFSSEEFRSITWDIDNRLYALQEALFSAEDAEAEAERLYNEVETDEAWNALNAATDERKRIEHTMEDLRKLAEAMYSAAIALDSLHAENEQELKTMGLI